MMRLCLTIGLLMSTALFMSCDENKDNELDGSAQKNYNITFKFVRARLYESELSIEYCRNESEVALRITLDVSAGLASGKKYDLTKNGTVSRDTTFGTLPDIIKGSLTLDEYSGKNGSEISGNFESTFLSDEGTEQSLYGSFNSELEVVPFK